MLQSPTATTIHPLDTFRLQDLGLLCGGYAGAGFGCENIIHSTFLRVQVNAATASAIRLNNGYSNTIEGCILIGAASAVSGEGNGIGWTWTGLPGVYTNNAGSIVGNQIYNNSGWGILVAGGLNINITRNTIEKNATSGIVAYNVGALNIEQNYFEGNGIAGWAFTTAHGSPENLNVNADIFLLSGAKVLESAPGYDVECCRITGNSFTPTPNNVPIPIPDGSDAPTDDPIPIDPIPIPMSNVSIFATVANNLRIENNQVYHPVVGGVFQPFNQMATLGMWNNQGAPYFRNPLVMAQNSDNSIGLLGAGVTPPSKFTPFW